MRTQTNKPLTGLKIAVLVANGFCEQSLTAIQRTLQPLGGALKIISMDQGLVNGWSGENWGLSFAVDQPLSEALAADYSALIVPGGERSIDKLKLTGHTRRFMCGFLDTGKPTVICGGAADLLVHIEKAVSRTISAPDAVKASVEASGAIISGEDFVMDDNLMTGDVVQGIAHLAEFLASDFSHAKAA